jgi:hypothetical protein
MAYLLGDEMKRKSIWIILEIVFLCLSFGNALTASDSESLTSKLPVALEVLNPRGEIPAVQTTGLSPRIKDLNGKKIGLIDNGKVGAGYFLDAVQEELKKRLPGATIVRFKKPGSTTAAAPKFYPDVAKKVDTFIYATGD